jgi:hypothetical protein
VRLATLPVALVTRIQYERHGDPGWDPFAEVHGLA